jgi:carotenoid cleavage dioxygenase
MFFFGYSPVGPPWLNVHRVDAAGTLCDSWAVDVPGPTMMHDFAITEHHLLFLDLPVVFDLRSAARRAVPVQWSPSYGARIGVQGRGGGEARWFDIESCYVFHTVNAFEDDAGLICLDVLRYRSIFNRENCDPELYRFTIDLVAGKVVETKVDDLVQEFPRIDDRKTGSRYRFSYSAQTPVRPGPLKTGGIVKNDMIAGNAVVNDLGGNRVPGEPVFVPAGPGEDEGWLMTLAYDPAEDASALVVLDAQDFTAAPVAEVLLPRRVPFGAHGSWVDTADAGVVNRR